MKLGSTYSKWSKTTKSVAQGSISGPVLFNIYLNDIYGVITTSKLFNYADDKSLLVAGKDRKRARHNLSLDGPTLQTGAP